MKNLLITLLCMVFISCSPTAHHSHGGSSQDDPAKLASLEIPESQFLSDVALVTGKGRRAGEGYFSADGNFLVYQDEGEEGNPFYQIYLRELATGNTKRISPGIGKTTCAWVHPKSRKALFASTHEDPNALDKQAEEIAFRKSGQKKRYAWDFDESFDIFDIDLKTNALNNLTKSPGYDAEGSYSPDGKKILFASNRAAYTQDLSDEEKALHQKDPAYFMDLYIMNADGSQLRQLTNTPGYDGGPFFSQDGKKVVWRRFSLDGRKAEVYTMNVDGSNQQQITTLDSLSWAPYFHPSGDYIIFASALLGHRNFELFLVNASGNSKPIKVTDFEGFDGLPVFSPDGTKLAWSSTRTENGKSQIFMANWNESKARQALGFR